MFTITSLTQLSSSAQRYISLKMNTDSYSCHDLTTPRRKVIRWLEDHAFNHHDCQSCLKKNIFSNLANTTTSVRTKALQSRLLRINKRRSPLQKKDEELAERTSILRMKAQELLQKQTTHPRRQPLLSVEGSCKLACRR